MRRDLLLLKIRNKIADKEFLIASANMETSRGGSWRCVWDECIRDYSVEIEELMDKVEEGDKQLAEIQEADRE